MKLKLFIAALFVVTLAATHQRVVFTWDYPDEYMVGTTFRVHASPDLATPIEHWPVLPSERIADKQIRTIEPPHHGFVVLSASNVWGVTYSDVLTLPHPPVPIRNFSLWKEHEVPPERELDELNRIERLNIQPDHEPHAPPSRTMSLPPRSMRLQSPPVPDNLRRELEFRRQQVELLELQAELQEQKQEMRDESRVIGGRSAIPELSLDEE